MKTTNTIALAALGGAALALYLGGSELLLPAVNPLATKDALMEARVKVAAFAVVGGLVGAQLGARLGG